MGSSFFFCVVCASWRLPFFYAFEVGRAAAGAEGAEAAEDDAEEEEGPGHGSSGVRELLVGRRWALVESVAPRLFSLIRNRRGGNRPHFPGWKLQHRSG